MSPAAGEPAAATSSQSQNSYITLTRRDGYVILAMHKEPVNSFNLSMWQQMEAALDALEEDTSVRGLTITTGLKRDVFTAGNDLLELYAPNTTQERYTEFWVTSNRFLCKLHRSRLATVVAVRGACPAAGCMMSMCCDYRVMSSIGAIGLNEVQLGISVPKYWGLLMARCIGSRAAEKLLTAGEMVSSETAKALGLVDQVVDKNEVVVAAENVMKQLVRLPPSAMAITKQSLREDFCLAWEGHYVREAEGAWQFLNQPQTLKTLQGAIQRLSSGSKPLSNQTSQRPKL